MQKYCIANTFLIPRTLYLSQKFLRHPYPVSSWGITFKENVIQLCHVLIVGCRKPSYLFI